MPEQTTSERPPVDSSIETMSINAIRVLAMDAVQKANSGHPGTPMALAPLGYLLWTRHMRHNPADPTWPDRDRFVLSAGHASMLLYSMLALSGYDLSLDELKEFRQWGSRTPGHPEHGVTPGVETTTGPLGQGVGNAVGMAIAEAHMAAVFNKPDFVVQDHFTYFIASDGDFMEGVSHEAASLAGHLRLGKLIGFFDDNHITIEGATSLATSDDVGERFEAYGWHVQRVADANDLAALDAAIDAAKAVTDRPSLVIVRSHIGYASPKQDMAEAHGSPLGAEAIKITKTRLGWPSLEPFFVPPEVVAEWRKCRERGIALEDAWDRRWAEYAEAYPEEARDFDRRLMGDLPEGWNIDLPTFEPGDKPMATRVASGKVLNVLAKRIPDLMGGAADLASSTRTLIADSPDFEPGSYEGRNMHFGIREHGMGAVLNGMALHGGIIPYGATFLIFSDYMRPPVRLAALTELRVILVYTHDSIGLGEDGPTHQPVEQLASLRLIPNLAVVRPADANETVGAWEVALRRHEGPTAIALTRQDVPTFDLNYLGGIMDVSRGAYVLADAVIAMKPEVIIMATGSEVHIALEAQQMLAKKKIAARVVSVPCLELFAEQPRRYRDQVLTPDAKYRVAIEAGRPEPWYRWVGDKGEVIGITRFGASAPYERLYREFKLTAEEIVARVEWMRGG